MKHNITLVCCPGARVGNLLSRMDHIQAQNFDLVVVHVGTNDITTLTPGQFRQAYEELIKGLKHKYGHPKVLASCVLPRPRDNNRTASQVLAFNKVLQHLITTLDLHSVCKSYRNFMRGGQVLEYLFRDGLHLTGKGSTLLAKALDGRINNIRW